MWETISLTLVFFSKVDVLDKLDKTNGAWSTCNLTPLQAQLTLWCIGYSSWKVIRISWGQTPLFAKFLLVQFRRRSSKILGWLYRPLSIDTCPTYPLWLYLSLSLDSCPTHPLWFYLLLSLGVCFHVYRTIRRCLGNSYNNAEHLPPVLAHLSQEFVLHVDPSGKKSGNLVHDGTWCGRAFHFMWSGLLLF